MNGGHGVEDIYQPPSGYHFLGNGACPPGPRKASIVWVKSYDYGSKICFSPFIREMLFKVVGHLSKELPVEILF